MVSIVEIARQAKVSTAAVSFVINNKYKGKVREESYQRIIEVIKRLNYQPNPAARTLRMGKTGIIGFFYTGTAEKIFIHHYYMEYILAFQKIASASNYKLLLGTLDDSNTDDQSYSKMFNSAFVDGWIISGPPVGHPIVETIKNTNLPVIMVGTHGQPMNITSVGADNVKASFDLTSHLLERKKKKLGFITSMTSYTFVGDRLKGYRDALKKKNIAFDGGLVIESDYSEENTKSAVLQLLGRKSKPDAIICINDAMALIVMRIIKELGYKVPEDVAVACFNDNPELLKTNPPVTTVRFPNVEAAELAAKILLDRIQNNNYKGPEQIRLDTELIIRASTK